MQAPSPIDWHVIYRETDRQIDTMHKLLASGKLSADEASRFCRWLWFSGVLKLLQNNPQPEPLPVFPAALNKKIDELCHAAGVELRLPERRECPADKSELEMIKDMLAQLLHKQAA